MVEKNVAVKPQKLAAAALELMRREMVVPGLFFKQGIDDFKGALDDTVNIKVPGVLTARDYVWRNDRTTAIATDVYKERKIAISFGGNAVSAAHLTDEEREFDFGGWAGSILPAQSKAVARALEYGAVDTLRNGKYAVSLGAKPENIVKDIVEARRVLNRAGASKVGRVLLVGSDWDAILQSSKELTAASVGDGVAETAFEDAYIGKIKGFTVVTSEEIDPGEAYALTGGAFVFLNAAPAVPDSVVGASGISQDGVAMRWIKDYDATHLMERSIVNTWYGFRQVVDPVVYWDAAKKTEVVSDAEYGIRAVKLALDGTDSYFAEGSDKTAVAKALKLDKRAKATTYVAPAGP
jgi:hypothetical protein